MGACSWYAHTSAGHPGGDWHVGTRIRIGVFAPALAVGAFACATAERSAKPGMPADIMPSERIVSGSEVEKTADGLVRVRAPELPGLLFVKPPRPHLQRYDRMILEPAYLSYKPGVSGWSDEKEEQLRGYFDAALENHLANGAGWTIAKEPGEGVLTVSISAIEMDLDTSGGPTGADVVYTSSPAEVTLVLELIDSVSDEPLLRFAERRRLQSGRFYHPYVDLARLKLAFDQFAVDIRQTLENFHAVVQEIERREQQVGGD
jgi:hypothetical protein